MKITTGSAEETFALGKKTGSEIKKGSVIALYGDLGAGKTLFTKGLAEGLGITEIVSSPTFTIVRVYESGRMPLYHFDVYRIGDIDEMDDVGYEEYFYGEGVSVIEWAGVIEELLPENTIRVSFETSPEDPGARAITITPGFSTPDPACTSSGSA